MNEIENRVAAHYGASGLLARIDAGLRSLGLDPETITPDDLKPVDEFHIGGAKATDELLAQVEIGPKTRVLDIGSGIGGAARRVATRFGAHVTGVDLTPEFVETATALSNRAGLSGATEFRVGSATSLPVEDGAFDLALLLHVGMNIEDKAALMREARRALRPGGTFAVYEVMRAEDPSPLPFPMPWAERPDFSFVEPLETYLAAARAAGFEVVASRKRREFAIAFFAAFRAALAEKGPPPLGLNLLMRETAGAKVANMLESVTIGRIEPTELILRAA